MKKQTLTIAILTAFFWVSCRETPKEETSQATENVRTTDEIVTSSLIGRNGNKLEVSFNKSTHKATFILNGESIEMEQDTVASGIKFSNKNYEYREHQGDIELKKDGETIFEK